ncbi:uncharacterized protein LOC118646716 [Monomorium pharaonis]|uniref:uncharacterized protein LOC118646716 n=1 Tax=Monomorium pharaonis TaxID=307658 RepID=UPI00063F87E6|nr:uncharacterized protein LOC118646716 [Monomorium pharaonis]XP_036146116.1 uncharacterized protein LOC118646716 [Monomorium pharaonis]XP_036146117.1 uncharacterized protein LOC118646716 [Monomorium pharaonis]XP_036146118.1 uncharacterized protein LOC118646716 [Monomorium pharaonis]
MAENEKIVSDERLYDYLRTYAKSIQLRSPKFHVIESNKGDSYISVVYRVTIEGIEEWNEAKKLELVLKTTRNYGIDNILTSGRVTELFQREASFYQDVLPIFKETMKDHGGMHDRFPILYDVNDESGKEILLLENLTPQGFVMSKSKIMDYPHLKLVMRCLGEFHAYSFITKAANPTAFEKMRQMKEHIFLEVVNSGEQLEANERMKKLGKMLFYIVLKALANEDKHYSERYQRFMENMPQNMFAATNGKEAEPYAVVNHGDCWTNNMLFKYDQEKNPCDLRFLDFQLCRYASPVLDLVHILFCCCTQETRSKCFDQIIKDVYYKTLSDTIKKAGYDPNVLFSYEILLQHFTKFGKHAAGIATFTVHYYTTNDVDFTSVYDTNRLEERIEKDSFYRNMLIETFKDIIDRNYI